ncbi:hypothetical protein PG985_005891 [Apiospora marii]|uniref:Uncharacterized protein n=1 Tax=Apiospora marii TaxID=335849 RepID=A0ABR1SC80_9PEZI
MAMLICESRKSSCPVGRLSWCNSRVASPFQMAWASDQPRPGVAGLRLDGEQDFYYAALGEAFVPSNRARL